MTRAQPGPATPPGQSQTTGFSAASILSVVFLALTLTAGFGAFLTASDPALQIANAEIEARKALDQYGYDWAKVRISGGTAIITGTAPNEAERIIAYQAVRGALHQAMVEEDTVKTINSRIALAEIKPAPIEEPAKVAVAEPAPAPAHEAPQPVVAVIEPTPAPAPVAVAETPPVPVPAPQVAAEAPATSTFAPEPVAAAAVTTLAPSPGVIAAATPPATEPQTVAVATPAPTAQKVAPVVETSAITKPAAATETGCKTQFSETLSKTKIAFGIDSAKIEKSSDELLDTLTGIARHCAHYKLTVEGHTDFTGRTMHNRMLSQRRADAVRTALIKRGIAKDKIVAKGYGASKPLVTGQNEAAYAQNRRIEIAVSELVPASSNAPHTTPLRAKR